MSTWFVRSSASIVVLSKYFLRTSLLRVAKRRLRSSADMFLSMTTPMSSLIVVGVSIFESRASTRWWFTRVSVSRNAFFCGKSAMKGAASGDTHLRSVCWNVSASAYLSS